jgi:GNAT superfamily N-acetyltransferase
LSTPRNWFIRAYREGDESKILELWKAVYPEKQYLQQQWLRWWHWKYKDIPSGSKTWLAWDNGKIVGQFPVLLLNLKVGNDIKKVAYPLDLMTQPDYRRQGIISTLEQNARDELAKVGINITIGFPNDISYLVATKLGDFDIAARRTMIRVFKWENTLKKRISNKFFLKFCTINCYMLNKLLFRASKTPVVKDLTITQVSCFDERINEFWARVSSQLQTIVVRSKDYLNWRYATVPDISYSIYIAEKAGVIRGYLVLRCDCEYRKKGVIFDLLSESEEVARSLLSTATEHCRRDNTDYIVWVGIANKTYLRAFRKSGFISRPFLKEGNFIVYSSAPDISKEFLRNPQNWLIQTGDEDVM